MRIVTDHIIERDKFCYICYSEFIIDTYNAHYFSAILMNQLTITWGYYSAPNDSVSVPPQTPCSALQLLNIHAIAILNIKRRLHYLIIKLTRYLLFNRLWHWYNGRTQEIHIWTYALFQYYFETVITNWLVSINHRVARYYLPYSLIGLHNSLAN